MDSLSRSVVALCSWPRTDILLRRARLKTAKHEIEFLLDANEGWKITEHTQFASEKAIEHDLSTSVLQEALSHPHSRYGSQFANCI